MTTTQTVTPVPFVTIYGKFMYRTLPIREAADFVAERGADVSCILGRMRPGYLGCEVLTLDDLDRWVHEVDEARTWAEIEDGERHAAENGLLR